jgi:hypothetical protein
MSLQASVHYYAFGGKIPHEPIPVPLYTGGVPLNRRMVLPFPRYTNPETIAVDIKPITEKIGIFPDPMKPKLMRDGGMTPNEMRNMVMGSHTPHATPIGSIHFEKGGEVPETARTKTVLAEIPTKGVDKVPALLQSGEIVIPKKYATKVNRMMKKEGIHLPNC